MEFFNPNTSDQFKARDNLLQTTMRPADPLFDITAEYPIVLAQTASQYSWCLRDGNDIIAHLNLWPRELHVPSENQTLKVGLIGNVATEPTRQGQGIMRVLMERIADHAQKSEYDALILWSDLLKFYQKMGFESVGQEFRITMSPNALEQFQTGQFVPTAPTGFTDEDLTHLLTLRPATEATIIRSPAEFRQLLEIPYTYIFTTGDFSQGYGIVGKGYDMAGVIHEWAVPDETLIPNLCADVAGSLGMPQIMLLCPRKPRVAAFDQLGRNDAIEETCPMALAKMINPSPNVKKALQTCFVWGLDSI